jgi:hypothetical protein
MRVMRKAPAGRVPADQRHRPALGRGPFRGVPVGARDIRAGREEAGRAA